MSRFTAVTHLVRDVLHSSRSCQCRRTNSSSTLRSPLQATSDEEHRLGPILALGSRVPDSPPCWPRCTPVERWSRWPPTFTRWAVMCSLQLIALRCLCFTLSAFKPPFLLFPWCTSPEPTKAALKMAWPLKATGSCTIQLWKSQFRRRRKPQQITLTTWYYVPSDPELLSPVDALLSCRLGLSMWNPIPRWVLSCPA